MNKLNELKEKKLDNKGFSLVELIIVIAIMAVLIGVLAPQYLRYVEKSRAASDRDNITAIKDAIQVYGADPDATTPLESGTVVLVRKGKTGVDADITGGGIAEALAAAGLPNDKDKLPNLQNQQTSGDKVTITVTVSSSTVTVEDDFDTSGTP